MPNSYRRALKAGSLVTVLLLCFLSLAVLPASAQQAAPPTALQKQLNRMDFAISASGVITDSVTGTNYTGVTFTQKGSSTVGTLVTLRYTAKPYVGFEFNFDHARFTEDLSNYSTCPNTACDYLPGGAQVGANEYTLGYVAHLPFRPLGITPYVGAGGGTIRFKPTPYGGQGLPFQYRAVYYYNLGLEDTFPGSNFGMRVGFRQLIYLAPDFLQNYLTIGRRARTSEPTIGFFVRF